jgi:hypothetical protein
MDSVFNIDLILEVEEIQRLIWRKTSQRPDFEINDKKRFYVLILSVLELPASCAIASRRIAFSLL